MTNFYVKRDLNHAGPNSLYSTLWNIAMTWNNHFPLWINNENLSAFGRKLCHCGHSQYQTYVEIIPSEIPKYKIVRKTFDIWAICKHVSIKPILNSNQPNVQNFKVLDKILWWLHSDFHRWTEKQTDVVKLI